MSVIKEIIKFNNLDVNLKFTLGSGVGLTGYQQEVDNLTIATGNELINPVVDTEVRKFTYDSSVSPTNLSFFFMSQSGIFAGTYSQSFVFAGFTSIEIATNNLNLLNSFFILDYYNTYNSNTQTKVSTNYMTKILGANVYNSPIYIISNTVINQFYNLYIPKSYIDVQTGSTIIGYSKFSFFNAKTGKISLFFNKENESYLTPEKMYFKTELNLTNNTWKFIMTTTLPVRPYEVPQTSAYVTRVNDTISKFDNKKQNYPSGNTFQSTDASYIIE